jgi:hypothetical protein
MASIFLRYCKNIGNILIVPMAVWLGKIFIDRLNTQPYRKYEMTFPMNTNADYKLYLDNLLHNYHQENPDSKIIVVIDDLDRLSSDKIVEALDALKMFMEYDRFVFIVPFDDSVLRQMIIKERYREICLSMDEFEADLILDKLFQYKIYMPLIPRSDISNYAIKLSNSLCGSFIKDYFKSDKDAFDEIIGLILIHNAVKTPRQVKKIINTFIENVMVARDRELAGQVEVGFATGRAGIETIAKLSVLQADFADFYNLLFYNASAMEEILEVHRGDGLVEPSKSLQRYFDDNNMLRRKYESLVNFLIVTEKCGRANIKSYLYIL